ncbi:glutamine amidotransferase-like class 1 domain-containing protein 1 isoform 4-T4 [Geothlypis trichas]
MGRGTTGFWGHPRAFKAPGGGSAPSALPALFRLPRDFARFPRPSALPAARTRGRTRLRRCPQAPAPPCRSGWPSPPASSSPAPPPRVFQPSRSFTALLWPALPLTCKWQHLGKCPGWLCSDADQAVSPCCPQGKPIDFVDVNEGNARWIQDFRMKSYASPAKLESIDGARYHALLIPNCPGAVTDLANSGYLAKILQHFSTESSRAYLCCGTGSGSFVLCHQ